MRSIKQFVDTDMCRVNDSDWHRAPVGNVGMLQKNDIVQRHETTMWNSVDNGEYRTVDWQWLRPTSNVFIWQTFVNSFVTACRARSLASTTRFPHETCRGQIIRQGPRLRLHFPNVMFRKLEMMGWLMRHYINERRFIVDVLCTLL